jgi:Tfp pilus assembly PilM family ATPase
MARPARIVTLSLGSQTIRLAEFRAQPHGGLVLHGHSWRELLSDPAGQGMRHAQIAPALREMMVELQIKSEKVNYAVAGQSVFARFVKLPAVEEEKIERIISFEAQQNVPFPIDEVVWRRADSGGACGNQGGPP